MFGPFKWKTPTPDYPFPRRRVDWSRKPCVCFYSSSHKVRRLKECRQGYQRVQGDPHPPHPNGTTLGGELVPDPPIHGFILLQQAGKGLSPLLSELPDWEKGGNCVVFPSLCAAGGWGRGVPRTLSPSLIAIRSGRVVFVFILIKT